MATTVIAKELANYLASLNTLGVGIFTDSQPATPDEAVTIYDLGGTDPQEPPELMRELYIQVRSKTHADGFERIWSILSYVLSPEFGVITVGANSYVAQLQEIPSIFDRDQNNRYLFGFRVTIYKVSGTITDAWLNSLVDWTETTLGAGWTVSSIWPGNIRPCVIWNLSGLFTTEGTGSAFRLHKRFTANILGNTPDDMMVGSAAIVSGLKDAIKMVLDSQNKRYLLVEDPRAEYPANSLTTAKVTVTLSRLTKRISEEMPLIGTVGTSGTIE